MDATVLGMDPLTFTLTALSALGLLCSTAAFLARRYGRWRWCYFRDRDLDLWLASAEGMDRVWQAFEGLCGIVVEAQCEGGPTGTCAGRGVHGKHLVRLRWHVERLEYKLKTLMLATTPRSTTSSTTSESPAKGGIVQTLRRWFKTIAFLRLSQEIRAFALSLRMITKQMERVKYARLGLGMGREDGLETMSATTTTTTEADDLAALEAAVEAAIEVLLASLPAPKPKNSSQRWKTIHRHMHDLEANNYSPRSCRRPSKYSTTATSSSTSPTQHNQSDRHSSETPLDSHYDLGVDIDCDIYKYKDVGMDTATLYLSALQPIRFDLPMRPPKTHLPAVRKVTLGASLCSVQ